MTSSELVLPVSDADASLFFLGVVIRFSLELVLSLSVAWVESWLSIQPAARVVEWELFFFSSVSLSCFSLRSLNGFMQFRILFDFHYVQIKLQPSHSSKSPMDHQNLLLRAVLTIPELFPRPIQYLYGWKVAVGNYIFSTPFDLRIFTRNSR